MLTPPGNFIAGDWTTGDGDLFESTNPATGDPVWQGRAAGGQQVARAVTAARASLATWASRSIEQRRSVLEAFAEHLKSRRSDLVLAICQETGKPRWESNAEVDSMIGKVAISIEANAARRSPTHQKQADVTSAIRYKPLGVAAVLGPFNFPGHLPNGHIVPALLAGNTVVFKPSEMAPLVATLTIECWHAAGLPAGVINLVQGARDVGEALVRHPDINAVFFTGSFDVGRSISRSLADRPGVITALEMGGNNPLIVHDVSDIGAAAYWTIQSAFITAGQRCSCARRLIVPSGEKGDTFINRLMSMMANIRIGPYTLDPEPFAGPVISDLAASALLASQETLLSRSARPLIKMEPIEGARRAMLRPGLLDVTPLRERMDVELFGPILQLTRVRDFEAAIEEANATHFGLAAGLFSDDRALYERFYAATRAGVVNWNRPLTGASSRLPFGGIANSGNGRPSAYFAADYCDYPIASLEVERLTMPKTPSPGIIREVSC